MDEKMKMFEDTRLFLMFHFFFEFEHVPFFFGFKQMFMSYLWNTEILENKNPNVS